MSLADNTRMKVMVIVASTKWIRVTAALCCKVHTFKSAFISTV